MDNTLRKITAHVRETKGSGEALRFYVNFIQPIKEYFGGDEEVQKINLHDVNQRSELLLDFMEHLSWYYGIDEVVDCSKHKHIIEQYIKSNNCA